MNIRHIYSPSTVLLVNDRVVHYTKAILLDHTDRQNGKMPVLNLYISKSHLIKSPVNDLIDHVFIAKTKLTFIDIDRCTILRTGHEFSYSTEIICNIDDIVDDNEFYVLNFTICKLNIEFFSEKLKQE